MKRVGKWAGTEMSRTLGVFAFFASGGQLAFATPLDDLKPGGTVSERIEVGKRTIPLPAGQWELAVKSERRTNEGSFTMVRASLFEIKDKRLTRLLNFEVNKDSGSVLGDWNNEPCKDKGDSYALDDLKSSFRDQYCIRIGYLAGAVDEASGDAFVVWARRIKDDGIAYSRDMPFVRVTRYKPGEWLSYQVSFNPQIAQVAASAERARSLNDWNPLHVGRSPDKKAFYDSLHQWAPRLGDALQKSFRYEPVSSQEVGEPAFTSSGSR